MCTNVLFLKVLKYCLIAVQLIRFMVPLGLIVKISFDLYKNMISVDSNSSKELIQRNSSKILAAIVIFILPSFINLFITIIENFFQTSIDYQSCISNAYNVSYYEEIENAKIKQDELNKNIESQKRGEEFRERQREEIQKNISKPSSNGGLYVGKKYNLTEKQLTDIAKICQREQGNAFGASLEASLMANRYELEIIKGSKWSTHSFYDYVLKCNWWSSAKKNNYQNTNLNSGVLSAVRSVLIDGQRKLPYYVDEHDYTGDITYIVTNGKSISDKNSIKNHSNYIKDVTVIHNKMGATYTYYTHASNSSNADPFGYTSNAKKTIDSLNRR